MKNVGLNLRLTTTLHDLVVQAHNLEIPFFQCFLTFADKGNYIQWNAQEYAHMMRMKGPLQIYAHGSYRINLANHPFKSQSCYFLKKELELAQKFGCTHVVIHPGSFPEGQDHSQGIDNIAKNINLALKKGNLPTILLENVAFGHKTIGGNIEDLAQIRQKIDKPEKVQFCIDTAHAFSYGYNIADLSEQKKFINLLDELLTVEAISLIHLNDTKELLGTNRDRHDIPGNGNIGVTALKEFIADPRLHTIPVLLELPLLPEHEMRTIVELVKSWK